MTPAPDFADIASRAAARGMMVTAAGVAEIAGMLPQATSPLPEGWVAVPVVWDTEMEDAWCAAVTFRAGIEAVAALAIDHLADAGKPILPAMPGAMEELVERLRSLDCIMVEVCVPDPRNPSPDIMPVRRADLIAALASPPVSDGGEFVMVPREAMLPNLLRAFRTTVSSPGSYVMEFKFPTMQAMHDADDEWHRLRKLIQGDNSWFTDPSATNAANTTGGVTADAASPSRPSPSPEQREVVARIVKGARLSAAFGREFRAGDSRLDDIDLDAADAILALASPPAVVAAGAMTQEEHRLEHLKMMAAYSGPIVSFDVREPYYLASCDACGWVGSSELCGTDSFGDDSDVYCPRCHASGADCGKIAGRFTATEALAQAQAKTAELEADVALWKREAADRSESIVQLNLDRAAMGVGLTQLREALTAVSAVRPSNWQDSDDPEQAAAWALLDATLQETARL